MMDPHDGRPARSGDRHRLAAGVLIAAALAIRIGVLAVLPATFEADPDNYRIVAVNLVEHGCFGYGTDPIATRPILYPLVVAACRLVDPSLWYSLAAVHVLLGVGTVVLTWCLAIRWGAGRWSCLAAALVAVDPILLAHSGQVMTETLATFLAAAGLLAATRCAQEPTAARAALSGAVMALAVLCRPTFVAWMGLSVILLPLAAGTWAGRLRLLAAASLAAVAVLGPWMVRNAVQFGKATATTHHGGYTLLLANNPRYYEHLRNGLPGEVWDAEAFNRQWSEHLRRLAAENELAADRLAYAEAFEVIRDNPRMFAWSCLVRLGQFWRLAPHRTGASEGTLYRAARRVVGAFYAIELLLAALGAVCLLGGRLPRDLLFRGWAWGLLLTATFMAVHTFYWTNVRMRAPLVPVICVAAALGLAQVVPTRPGRERVGPRG
ncbi:MAG: ArnT family glycosyltransferase [Thermoguttaceae bacterium]